MGILNKIILGVLFCGLAVPSMGSLEQGATVDVVGCGGGGGGGGTAAPRLLTSPHGRGGDGDGASAAAAVESSDGADSSSSSAVALPRAGEGVPGDSATIKGTEVIIFDVGQGNCVLVRHEKEIMLFDAGSKEDSFSKLYDRLFGYGKQRYRFGMIPRAEDKEEDKEEGAGDLEDLALKELAAAVEEEPEAVEGSDGAGASPSRQTKRSDISSPCSEPIYTHRHGAPKGLLGEKGRAQLAAQIDKEIGADEVKCVVVSHGDVDHYNLLPKIFPTDGKKYIDNLILGGVKKDYTSKSGKEDEFVKWVRENAKPNGKIRKLIYTGEDGNTPPTYFRAYSAAAYNPPTRTSHEQTIENALLFTGSGPRVEILSMNSGHSQIGAGAVYRSNPDPNANSMVLRIKSEDSSDSSLILPGDADESTWNFIKEAYRGREGDLETQYLLLSHHGAELKGSNSEEILDLFKPKICFISVGVYISYKHPQGDVIDRLKDAGYVEESKEERRISYFRGEKEEAERKRRVLKKHIYSTLDDGTIKFLLQSQGELKLETTRSRKHALQENPVDISFQRKDTTLQRIYGSFAEFKRCIESRVRRIKNVFFVQCSPQYNLILPLTEDMDGAQGYYLYTLDPSHKKCTRGIGFEISKLALTTG